MFHFPGCPPHELFIHSWVTGHYPSRVPPFGYPRIYAYLRLPWAFRSLSRPSSAISALASSLRSSSLDLPAGSRAPSALAASSLLPLRYVHLPKTIEKCPYLSSFGLRSALPTGFLPRFPSTSFGFFFPCAVFKVRLCFPPSLPVCLSLPLPFPLPAAFEVSLFSDPSKRYSEEFPSDANSLSLRWLCRSYSLSTRRFSIGSPIMGPPISCRSFRLSRFASALRLSPSRFRSPLRPRMRMNSPSIPFSLERR